MRGLFNSAVLSLLLLGVTQSSLEAAPIVYSGVLSDGVPVAGVNLQPPGSGDDPVGAVYYSFFATAGSLVTVDGDRAAGHYDMALWIFNGEFSDTSAFGAFFSAAHAAFVRFGDDESAPAIPGPFGDPLSSFLAPVTGNYTVAVTNFSSSASPPNPFSLTATGVSSEVIPEPSTIVLSGIALLSLAAHLLMRRGRVHLLRFPVDQKN